MGRLEAGGKQQAQTFTPAGVERRTASVSGNGTELAVSAGLENLVLLRTSGFAPTMQGMASDEPTDDGVQRLFIATLSARWSYVSGDIAFVPYRAGVRQTIVETFAWHKGPSVQATLSGIAEALLTSYLEIAQVDALGRGASLPSGRSARSSRSWRGTRSSWRTTSPWGSWKSPRRDRRRALKV